MADQKYEHRVVTRHGDGGEVATWPTEDPVDAGREYREHRAGLAPAGGGTVEIQRRPVGDWETVERTEVAG